MIKTYITKAFSNKFILPNTPMPDSEAGDHISARGCRGQFIVASFVVFTDTDLEDFNITVKQLSIIAPENFDIRVVKPWYQTKFFKYPPVKNLTPELLLHNDSMVITENNENYLRLENGELWWISEPNDTVIWGGDFPMEDHPIRDASSLQPLNIPANTNKQFWLRIHIPEFTRSDQYNEVLVMSVGETVLGEITLSLEVLPFRLSLPKTRYNPDRYMICGVYYYGTIDPKTPLGNTMSKIRTAEQVHAELLDLHHHGINEVFCRQTQHDLYNNYPSWNGTELYFSFREQIGMNHSKLIMSISEFAFALWNEYYDVYPAPRFPMPPEILDKITERAESFYQLARSHGYKDIYNYGVDEASPDYSDDIHALYDAQRRGGVKVVTALSRYNQTEAQVLAEAPYIDLAIIADRSGPVKLYADTWHNNGGKVLSYANPQAGREEPQTYRRNYGVKIYFADYDGFATWTWMDYKGNPWNDYDCMPPDNPRKKETMVLPTIDGVVGTTHWEGYGEAVTDIRYLSTLANYIIAANAQGIDATLAENYMNGLSKADLSTVDLDKMRDDITDHILYLSGLDVTPGEPPKAKTNLQALITAAVILVIVGMIITRGKL